MSRVRTLRRGREASARALFLRVVATVGAVAVSLAVVSFLQVPLAAVPIAEALPPQPPTELLGERTASSRTLDNHDGTFTTSLYPGPVHYRDQQGAWRPIGSRLVAAAQDGYAWRNEANSFDVRFKQDSRTGYLALDAHGRRFALSLEGAAQVNAQTRQHGLTYPSVFPHVDLRYDLRSESVKETLILANAQAPTSYRFRLSVPSDRRVHAARQSDGSWAFYMAPRARPVLVLDAPWAAEDGVEHPVQPHASLAVTRAGDDFLLDLAVDGPWLRDPSRRFPVRVDPTITIQPDFQDASFDGNCPTCKGTATDRLPIGSASTSSAKWRAALQFTLSDIPSGATVNNARLKLYHDGTCLFVSGPTCGGTAHQIDAHRMTQSWSKASTTAQLGYDLTALTSYTLPASAGVQWMDWDLTTTVQNWVSGTQSNFGLLLKRTPEPAASSGPMPPSRRYAPEPALGPKLEVTYNGEGAQLLDPETLHANGAELRWLPYAGPMAPPFDKYEVHRSTSPTFTPSDSTRLMTTLDSTITSFRDTTAKAGTTFTYKIVANNVESNPRTVTLPAAGQAQKVLRPDPTAGRDGYITFRSDYAECANRGTAERLKVGTDTNSIFRSLLRFDLGDLPADTTVSAATLQLWHPETAAQALTVRAHRVTAAWEEGTESGGCSGDGATWYETTGGAEWLANGGDFDAASVASLAVPAGQAAGWHSFSMPALVQQWARGEKPNQGLLFKADPETIVAGKFLDYYASDFEVAPTLRPKLSVTYTETSAAVSPTIAIAKPAASELVKGTAVTVSAGAWDDHRVDSVQFFADGNSIGTDSSDPFSISWNSTAVANGAHSLTARATDDAGNQTISPAVGVTVGNSAAPTTAVTAPAEGANVTGTVAVTANAGDDVGVTKVEFYIDGALRGEDTTPPSWSMNWNTLDPLLPSYDGPHTVTTKAYDGHGNVTTSAPRNVNARNAEGTRYLADLVSTAVPAEMRYDPALQTQRNYGFDVSVTNRSLETWAVDEVVLRYRWFSPAGTVVDGGYESLGTLPILPNGEATVRLLVPPPAPPDGAGRAGFTLRFDLYDDPTRTWFADSGNKPIENPVDVHLKPEEPTFGVEPYFQYSREELGLGIQNLVNLSTGNSVVRWSPLQSPGRGLSTVVEMTHNSREECGNERPACRADLAGNGWSFGVSSLARFATPLDRHPNQAETLGDQPPPPDTLTLIDVDGTRYQFELIAGRWRPPSGVHLYLRQLSDGRWALTRPDGVTFVYNQDKLPDYVEDRDGNRITFGYTNGRITTVTDAGGHAQTDRYTIAYWSGRGPKIDGKVQTVTDHGGHAIDFEYYDDGNLLRVTERGGVRADGSPLPPRSVVFTYTTSNGDGPAIPDPQMRRNPPPHTSPQSDRLFSVIDPLQNETTFAYVTNPGHARWKLASRTDREGAITTFSYSATGPQNPFAAQTIVTEPPAGATARITRYEDDERDGSTERIVRRLADGVPPDPPVERTTALLWTQAPDEQPGTPRHVQKVTEPGGGYTEFIYNANGMPLEQRVLTAAPSTVSRTLYTYRNSPTVDGPQSILPVSDLATKTLPNGAASGSHTWRVTYISDAGGRSTGRLEAICDPTVTDTLCNLSTVGATKFSYYGSEQSVEPLNSLKEVKDARGNPTTFSNYHARGFPRLIEDAAARRMQAEFSTDGLLSSIQDPLHVGDSGTDIREYRTVFDYDSFHRLGRRSSPKSTRFDREKKIWEKVVHDANDNVVSAVQPRYDSDPEVGRTSSFAYDRMDRQTRITEPETNEITELSYDGAGRVTRINPPKGVVTPPPPPPPPPPPAPNLDKDYATEFVYDRLDRVVSTIEYAENGIDSRRTHYCFDAAGDLRWLTAPKAGEGEAPSACSAGDEPTYTTRFTYDAAHRLLEAEEPLDTDGLPPPPPDGHETRTRSWSYDANGNVVSSTDGENTQTQFEYTQRDELKKTIEVFNTSKTLTSAFAYDAVGNLIREVTPRAWDAAGGQDPVPAATTSLSTTTTP